MQLGQLELSSDERLWLESVADAPGFSVTCDIQRRWRRLRVQAGAPLTLTALGADRHSAVDAYLSRVPLRSMFVTPEVVGFTTFVAHESGYDLRVRAVAAFERALKLAVAGRGRALSSGRSLPPGTVLCRHPSAAMVPLPCRPEALFGALLSRGPLPDADQPTTVLVAPGLATLWRPASLAEVDQWDAHEEPRLSRGPSTPVLALLEAGALCEQETAV